MSDLKLGSRGNAVAELQNFLIAEGYLTEKEEFFGVSTKKAVRNLQKDINVLVNGIWSDSLYDLYNIKKTEIDTGNTYLTDTAEESAWTVGNGTFYRSTYKKGNGGFVKDNIPCYVINTNTGTVTPFDLIPESISQSFTASYSDNVIKGRSSPIKGYDSSGPSNLSFSITLHADYCPNGIVQTVNALRALTSPHKSGVIVSPKCFVRIGDFIKISAVCTSVGVEWATPYRDNIFSKAEVSLSFDEVEDTTVYDTDVESM